MIRRFLDAFKRLLPSPYKIILVEGEGYLALYYEFPIGWVTIDEKGRAWGLVDMTREFCTTEAKAGARINKHASRRKHKKVWP